MNKAQIKQQIINGHSSYLGFKVDGVNGLSSKTKDELLSELKEIKQALRFKLYADKIVIDRLQGYFAKEGTFEHSQFIRVQLLTALANKLWHKTPYSIAKEEVRKQILGIKA